MKRIVICADGTWDRPEQRDRGRPTATNVAKFASAVLPQDREGHTQIVYYHKGVGAKGGAWDWLTGGVLGDGIDENIEDAYLFLANNYEPSDELFLIGFSRGAYTARSLAGLIRNSGILKRTSLNLYKQAYDLYRDRDPNMHPRAPRALQFRRAYAWPDAQIRFIGVWDTVGSLGIPVPALRFWNKRRYEFHDVSLSTQVRFAYQALAIDERRGPYMPTLWTKQLDALKDQVLEQAWFPGTHDDVGGGCAQTGLSDGGLTWMCDRAARSGLMMDLTAIRGGDADAPIHKSQNVLYELLGDGTRTPGATNPKGFESIHRSAVERREHDGSYGGKPLAAFMAQQPTPPVSVP